MVKSRKNINILFKTIINSYWRRRWRSSKFVQSRQVISDEGLPELGINWYPSSPCPTTSVIYYPSLLFSYTDPTLQSLAYSSTNIVIYKIRVRGENNINMLELHIGLLNTGIILFRWVENCLLYLYWHSSSFTGKLWKCSNWYVAVVTNSSECPEIPTQSNFSQSDKLKFLTWQDFYLARHLSKNTLPTRKSTQREKKTKT